jgi:hypothetical protein
MAQAQVTGIDRRDMTILAWTVVLFGGCSGGGGGPGRPAGVHVVGQPCDITTDAGMAQAVANTNATNCPSQICLKPRVEQNVANYRDTGATCTAECSRDSDCVGDLRDPSNPLDKRCQSGFACGIPFEVGPLCCKKLCMCKDFLPPSGVVTPSACTGGQAATCAGSAGGGSPTASVQAQTDIYLSVAPNRLLDLVLMIDNSPGMAGKVSKLNSQFPKLIAALQDPSDGTLPDLRVAIIDTDLGTGGAYQSGSCGPKTLPDGTQSPFGDLGRFQMINEPAACTFNAGAEFLEYRNGQPVNYTGDINTVFACLAGNMGSLGCGEEHPLQAFEFALAARGVGNERQQADFLRANAYLGLVILSDEDDCSAAPNDGMFGDKSELRGESASLRCATRGHMCSGKVLTSSPPGYPTESSFTANFADCMARTDTCPNTTDGWDHNTDTSVPTDCSPLKNVQHLAGEIKALKGDPENQILVAGIFGWPRTDADFQSAKYKIAPVPNPNTVDTQHPTVYDYWPVCYDPDHMPASSTTDSDTGFDNTAAGWGATGGLRMSAFVDEFGDNGLKFSICERDFANWMKVIGDSIAMKLQNLCVNYKLVDQDADASNGLQPDCRVVFRTPQSDPNHPNAIIYAESPTPLPMCAPGAANGNVDTDCWRLTTDKTKCPVNGQLVLVLRTAAEISAGPLTPGTKLTLKCRTCTDSPTSIPGCDYSF